MIALRTVPVWVIAPPFLIEKAGLMMTLRDSKIQSILLRIAYRNMHSQHVPRDERFLLLS
jgi:hypothetical protein